MKIRVQTVNETTDTIELPDMGWRVLRMGELNCLVGAGLTHSFTPDGSYQGTTRTIAILEKDISTTSN